MSAHFTAYLRPFAWSAALLLASILAFAPSPAAASPVDAANAVRREGCGRYEGTRPLRREARLDAAAGRMARGASMKEALDRAGYRADEAVSLHLAGSSVGDEAALERALARRFCSDVANPKLTQIGVARDRQQVWMILALPFEPPAMSEMPRVAKRVLALVNATRASGQRCGGRRFEPAPPLALSARLSNAALAHSREMAATSHFEHEGPRGDTPAMRVQRAGYDAARVGENIAYGPTSPEEVVQGWIDSPGHCANLMDPKFAEMGLAYAIDTRSRGGIYWTQVFAKPR
jgi:uncharacterized protein YkwD